MIEAIRFTRIASVISNNFFFVQLYGFSGYTNTKNYEN